MYINLNLPIGDEVQITGFPPAQLGHGCTIPNFHPMVSF